MKSLTRTKELKALSKLEGQRSLFNVLNSSSLPFSNFLNINLGLYYKNFQIDLQVENIYSI